MASALTINKTRIYLNNNPLCHQTVVDHIATNDHFVRIPDISIKYFAIYFLMNNFCHITNMPHRLEWLSSLISVSKAL